MLVYRKKKIQEAVNFQELTFLLPPSEAEKQNEKALCDKVLSALGEDGKPLTDRELKAYGTSRKELMDAVELLVKWYSGDDIQTLSKLETRFKRMYDREGKIDRSAAFNLAIDALERMSDEDFYDMQLSLAEEEGIDKFEYLNDDCRKLFNISDKEADKAFQDNRRKLGNALGKVARRRTTKKIGKKLKTSVQKAVNSAKSAGRFISRLFKRNKKN